MDFIETIGDFSTMKMMKWMLLALLVAASPVRAESVSAFEPLYLYYNGSKMDQVETELDNSCGPMSTLIVNHFFDTAWDLIPPSYSDSYADVTAAVGRLYDYLGLPNNSETDIADLYNIFKHKWGYGTVKIRSTTYYPGFENSYSILRYDLGLDRPAIVLFKADSDLTPYNVKHFVVVYSADDNFVKYADPWTGTLKTITKAQFHAAWVDTYLSVVSFPVKQLED